MKFIFEENLLFELEELLDVSNCTNYRNHFLFLREF